MRGRFTHGGISSASLLEVKTYTLLNSQTSLGNIHCLKRHIYTCTCTLGHVAVCTIHITSAALIRTRWLWNVFFIYGRVRGVHWQLLFSSEARSGVHDRSLLYVLDIPLRISLEVSKIVNSCQNNNFSSWGGRVLGVRDCSLIGRAQYALNFLIRASRWISKDDQIHYLREKV